jgi:hypothetical protein
LSMMRNKSRSVLARSSARLDSCAVALIKTLWETS